MTSPEPSVERCLAQIDKELEELDCREAVVQFQLAEITNKPG
jgi:hypothetical protein